MAEYNLKFSEKLAEIAVKVDEEEPFAYVSRRATVYLSRLSAEISLKALLEQAGVPVRRIRGRSHNLSRLLKDVGKCEIEINLTPETKKWVPASRVRSVTLDMDFVDIPIGALIEANDDRISKYPNEIRYGEKVVDFHPSMMSEMAVTLAKWAKEHSKTIRVRRK